MAYRLLALDADGTLLDSKGEVRPAVAEAVAAARARGIEPVVCTGRRHRTARPVLEALGLLDGEAVVQNGVLVVDADSGAPSLKNLLPSASYARAHSLLSAVSPPLAYMLGGPPDFASEAPEQLHPFQREYVEDYRDNARIVDTLARPPSEEIVMLSVMADREALAALRPAVHEALGEDVRTHLLRNRMYRGYILEILSARAGKWNALAALARRRGIAPAEIVAIGDDQNDHEMIEGAGLGIAMEDAPGDVRDSADWVAPSSDDDGVAVAIERFLLQ